MKRIDIHSHILPGLDDGANNEKESLEMFRMAAEDGISHIIATPHFHYRKGHAMPEEIKKMTAKMNKLLSDEGIPIQIYTGNELYYSHELLEMVKAGQALTLANSDYVLLEFSHETEKIKIQNAVYQFLTEGYYPVIAHVERYHAFRKYKDFAKIIYDMGAYLQVNSESLFGTSDWSTKRYTKALLESGRIHFVATDAHEGRIRRPQFGKVAEWIEKKYGESKASQYLHKNPQMILENRIL